MSQYTSEYPPVTFSQPYRVFFEQFYKISDTPDAHDKYADSFTEDATLVMASKKAQGREEILSLRKGMWEHIASRSHNPIKIFPFGPNSDEVMLYGTVAYKAKSGKESTVEWAARATLVTQEGTVRMSYYQVYLDTAAMAK